MIIKQKRRGADGNEYISVHLEGVLNGHDVMMTIESFFCSRTISKRGYFDAGSDYNPEGWEFHRKLKDLEWIAAREVVAS